MAIAASRLAFPLVIWALGPVAVLSPVGVVPLGLGGALLLLASPAVRRRLWADRTRPLPILLAIFLLWAAIACAWAPQPLTSLTLLLRLGGLFVAGLVYLAGIAEMDEVTKERALHALAFAGPILLLFLSFELASDGLLARLVRGSPADWEFNHVLLNRSAAILAVFTFPFTVALWRRVRPGAAILFLALATLHFPLVPMTAAPVAFGTGGILFLFAWRWPLATSRALLAAALVGVLLIPPVLVASDARDLLPRVAQHLPEWSTSAQHRLLIDRFVLGRIAERPLAGFGFDSSRKLPGGKDPALLGQPVLPLHPHNGVFQMWLELGAVGAVLLAGLLALVLDGVGRLRPRGPAAMACASFAAFSTLGLVSFGIWQYWWVMLGWLAAVIVLLAAKDEPA